MMEDVSGVAGALDKLSSNARLPRRPLACAGGRFTRLMPRAAVQHGADAGALEQGFDAVSGPEAVVW
jgi:hypothetical protein